MEFSEKFKDLMETEGGDDDVESENIHESFICCVCRDLLYKPIVLACGHVSCFWCVHKSMSGLDKSRCPICRNHYYHFPSICQTLHLLLLKMYPSAYKRREKQILEDEKEMGCFSPQLSGPVHQLQPEKTIGLASLLDRKEDVSATNVMTVEDRNANRICRSENCKHVSLSVDDVLCGYCKDMLFQPIVLNCGHAFCMCCIALQTDVICKCGVCQSPHPGDIPKVCLELDHFLEEQFPEEYRVRRDALQMKQEKLSSETANTCSSEVGNKSFHFSLPSVEDPFSWLGSSTMVHFGVGCDTCGMYPITGDRYRCKDCVEKIGYDLCKDCYTTRSKLPGRFNQQHTSEHKFEIIKSNPMHNIMLRMLRGQLQEVSDVSDASNNTSENAISLLSNNTNEEAEDASLPSSDIEANQRENQRSG